MTLFHLSTDHAQGTVEDALIQIVTDVAVTDHVHTRNDDQRATQGAVVQQASLHVNIPQFAETVVKVVNRQIRQLFMIKPSKQCLKNEYAFKKRKGTIVFQLIFFINQPLFFNIFYYFK